MNESLLSQVPLFATLPAEEVERLASTLDEVVLGPDTVFIREGELGDELYVVLAGRVEIVKALGSADERLLGVRETGAVVGEMSLLSSDGLRTASIRTNGSVRLLRLTRADFDALLHRYPPVAYAMLRMLSTRLRDAHNAALQDLQQKNIQLLEANARLQSAQAQVIAEVEARTRIEQELHVAHLIQQQFLPRELPDLPGWKVAAYYQAAGAVGGDFYDFIELPGGLMGIVIGDVTDKGVPAALVMATTQSSLRSEALRQIAPGKVLERANTLLYESIPPHMFATCAYLVLDPATGYVRFANAGHHLPYIRTAGGVTETWAKGGPLGLLPGMSYVETELSVDVGDTVLLYTDGLVEAHNSKGEIVGRSRLHEWIAQGSSDSAALIEALLANLTEFTGPDAEKEDDVTLVALRREVPADKA